MIRSQVLKNVRRVSAPFLLYDLHNGPVCLNNTFIAGVMYHIREVQPVILSCLNTTILTQITHNTKLVFENCKS